MESMLGAGIDSEGGNVFRGSPVVDERDERDGGWVKEGIMSEGLLMGFEMLGITSDGFGLLAGLGADGKLSGGRMFESKGAEGKLADGAVGDGRDIEMGLGVVDSVCFAEGRSTVTSVVGGMLGEGIGIGLADIRGASMNKRFQARCMVGIVDGGF